MKKKSKAKKQLKPQLHETRISSTASVKKDNYLNLTKLVAFLNLSVVASYLYEFHELSTSLKDGGSMIGLQDLCSKYLTVSSNLDTSENAMVPDLCTSDDLFFIRLKYSSLLEYMILSSMVVILSWQNEGLLRRLATYVGTCPLMVNVCVIVFFTRNVLNREARQNTIVLQICLLILTSRITGSTRNNRSAKMATVNFSLKSNTKVADAVLILLSVSSALNFLAKIFSKSGDSNMFIDLKDITSAALLLLRLSAIDDASLIMLFNFVRHYFNPIQKKVRL